MPIGRVLVVGAGITGCVAAIALARRGVEVELAEQSSRWGGAGHGITVHGNALRALASIGLADAVIARGVPFDRIRVHDASGSLLADVPTPRTGGADLPPTLGMLRSDLQAVLVERIVELGVPVSLGTRPAALDQDDHGVSVRFEDGRTARYDVVVGADGIRSRTRGQLGIGAAPAPSGMGIWRFVTDRTAAMDSAAVYYGGPWYKAGFAPISAELCYGYVLTDPALPPSAREDHEVLRELLSGYHGDFDVLREGITAATFSNFQPIEWLLVDEPWHRGRVVVVGDAVHACPPLIAQGAAMCTEDAVLLAEHLTDPAATGVGASLRAFWERRAPRVKLVLDASLQMVEWELHPQTPGADLPGLMESSLARLTAAA